MRNAFLTVLAIVMLTSSSLVFSSERTPTAFVGSFVNIVELECESGESTDAKTGEAVVVICMDALYQATYRVEKVLEGKLVAGSEVTFSIADHYGFPKFAEQNRALLFLDEHDGSYYHIKYQWAAAFRTNDGDYAQCGCDLNDAEAEANDYDATSCRSLSFSPPVTRDLTHASHYVINKLSAGLEYKIQGNRAECIRGILVEDLYKRLRPELIEDINVR